VRAAARILSLVLLAVVACSPMRRTATAPAGQGGRQAGAGERAYRTPPSVLDAVAGPGPRVRLDGLADPGSRIRLATPSGQALFARTDAEGRWRAVVPQSQALRLFGLSMIDDRQVVQSDGYLALTPAGAGVRLRSGAGAVVLSGPCGLCLTAVDYDRKGGTVISGRARPGQAVVLAVDGSARGQVAADAAGLYWLDLDEPLGLGPHRLQAASGPLRAAVDIQLIPPAPLPSGPFAADRTASGWRIEWVTPGRGIQTTLVLDREGTAG
jgi:hypothetical protein